MKTISITTSSIICGVCILEDEQVLKEINLNNGLTHSESLMPLVSKILEEVNLTLQDMDLLAIDIGPGSFTGLRLGMSALKAINLCHNIPLYACQTLDVYAHNFRNCKERLISVIDAKKDRFYASIYSEGKCICEPFDEEPQDILRHLDENVEYLVVGTDSPLFCEAMKAIAPNLKLSYNNQRMVTTDALFEMAEEKIAKKEPPLQDYDGPFYIRKSEAEEKLPQQ